MAKKLTARQAEILHFIEDYFASHNTSPTLNEMAEAFSISPAGASFHIQALEKKGLVTMNHGSARSITLTRWKEHISGVALVPLYDEKDYLTGGRRKKGEINVSSLELDRDGDYFALRVESQHFENAAIRPGDRLVLKKTSDAKDGDLVVASLEGGEKMHLRTYRRQGGKIILQAECDSIGNISCQSCTVHAIVQAVVRRYV